MSDSPTQNAFVHPESNVLNSELSLSNSRLVELSGFRSTVRLHETYSRRKLTRVISKQPFQAFSECGIEFRDQCLSTIHA
jgi:hypothetical protein